MRNYKKLSLNKVYLEIILLLVPFFRPDFITSFYADTIIDYLFILYRVFAFFIICFKYFVNIKRQIQGGFILISLYEAEILISAIINHESINSRVIDIGNALGIYMIFMYFGKKYFQKVIDASFGYLSFLIVINALLSLIFPHGLNQAASDTGRINFLGMDNVVSYYFVFCILLAVLYLQQHPSRKIPYIIIGIILLNELYYFSGTGIIATIFFVLLIILFYKKSNNRVLYNPIIILVGFGILEFFIVFLQNVSRLGFLFELLGKSATFSDRFFYWQHGIAQFLDSTIIGIGSGTVDLWGNNYYSHNAMLDVLMKGGILGAVFWIIMILIPLKNLWTRSSENRAARLICIALIPFLLIGLMEGLEDRIVFNAYIALAFSNENITNPSYCKDKVQKN